VHLIDLTRSDTQPLDFDQRLRLASESWGEDVVRVGELHLEGHVERTSQGYHLGCRLEGEATLRCVRCLGEFALALDEQVELELIPAASAPREDETRLGKTELDVVFFDAPSLDLAYVAAEQVLLSVPMKPLCKQECRGFCSRCGKNLNEGPCECPPETDARWATLQQWRPSE
jgi:uncharacterized protein